MNTTLGEDDGVFMVDGSDFPKQGEYSVGVKRQYCGQLEKLPQAQLLIARVLLPSRQKNRYSSGQFFYFM